MFTKLDKKPDNISALLQRYDSILNYLRTSGALLGAMRPEYLLSYEDYMKYRNANSSDDIFQTADLPTFRSSGTTTSATVVGNSNIQKIIIQRDYPKLSVIY